MMHNTKYASIGLFLLGTFSFTQVHIIGNIGISELVVFILAPFIFLSDFHQLKHDGFIPIIVLVIFVCIGCVVSSSYNNTQFRDFMRGFASPYAIFSVLVIGHRLVLRSQNGHKWFWLGVALSGIINIFIFQRGVEADGYAEGARGLAAIEGVMHGPLFWIGRIKAWICVPTCGWYLQTPIIYSILAPIFMFFFAALTTASGRSAAAAALGAAILIVLGGKRRVRMQALSKNFWFLVFFSLIIIQLLTYVYKTAALSGVMGEAALKKYEVQTRGQKKGVLGTLMGGRLEFFVGSYAAIQKPIVGYGPWARDWKGFWGDFLSKYGNGEDFDNYMQGQESLKRYGHIYIPLIPTHSHIIGFWVWYGIFGLIFWVYVIWQIIRYFRFELAVMPQWFGMFAVMTPTILWDIFFSPFGNRVTESMYIVYLLFTHAIRKGAVTLSTDSQNEMLRT